MTLLSNDKLATLKGQQVKLVYYPPFVTLDSDADPVEIDGKVVIYAQGQAASGARAVPASYIIYNPLVKDDTLTGEHKFIIKEITFKHHISRRPGLIWGERLEHYYQYTFYADNGDVYQIDSPLYY